jgi:TPR repeat protein
MPEDLLRLSATKERRAEIEAAASAGDADALALSGLAWLAGTWGSADVAQGYSLLQAAAAKGHARAMAVIFQLLWEGTVVPQNQPEALQWLRKAVAAGNGVAETDLAFSILNKQTTAAANEDPIKLLQLAADKGVSWAMRFLGDIYYSGAGVPKDDRKSREWYERAARAGDLQALASAGSGPLMGEREPQPAKMLGFAKVELAAQSGNIDAITIAAAAYLGGPPDVRVVNPPAALALLEQARASVGKTNPNINRLLPIAQNAVGQMRRSGDKMGLHVITYRLAGGGTRTVEMTDKQIVDAITIVPTAWPDGVPAPALPNIPGDRSPVDEYGVSEREWREMAAAQFTAFVMRPEIVARVAQGYANRDPKALTLIALVAASTYGGLDIRPGYPQCFKASGDSSALPAYCEGLENRLRTYLDAVGIAADSKNPTGIMLGSLYPKAIAGYLAGKSTMRAQLEPMLPHGLYNDRDMARMLAFADLGFLPAIKYLVSQGSECSGSKDVRRFLINQGRNELQFVDAAMALGDARIGFDFAKRLRGGLCIGRDPDGAARLFRLAADMGDVDAKYELMMMYAGYSPGNFSRNYRKALSLAQEIETQQGLPLKPELMAQLRDGAASETKLRAAIGEVTDNPAKAPNSATIRAAMMRELRWTMQRFSGIGLASLFGNPPYENWNYDDGSFLYETQNPNDMFRVYYRSDFSVTGAACKPVAGKLATYDCSYLTSASLDWRFGSMTLVNTEQGTPRRRQDRFEFVDGQWRSASIRANIMANMNTNGIGATGSSSGGGRNGFCKSLYAGVVAAGGSSPDKGLDPNTWGC